MSEILIPNAVPNRDKNYNYKIDRQGNVIRQKYSIFTDPYSLVTLCVILMGILYYTSIINNPLAVKNIDKTCSATEDICSKYVLLKQEWIAEHPGKPIDVRAIINMKVDTNINQSLTLNFTYE